MAKSTKAKRSQPSKVTINSVIMDKKLRKDFVQNEPKLPKTKELQRLMKRYGKKLSQPVMTPSNLVAFMQYVRKHHTPERDYGKVATKVGVSHSVLSQNDLSDIYEDILTNSSDHNRVNYHNAKYMYKYFTNSIRKALVHFMNFRLLHLGTFVVVRSKGGKYYNPATGKIEKKGPYSHILFHPNGKTKKDVSSAKPVKKTKSGTKKRTKEHKNKSDHQMKLL